MARPRRVHVPGGLFHLTQRGNHRESLFGSGGDRDVLTAMVRDGMAKYGVRVLAFCWMTNHTHMLVQAGQERLGKVIGWIATRYSRYRHRRLFKTGHLFERRFFSEPVEDDRHFIALLRYIHLNPVEAGLTNDPARHRWSSHRAHLGEEQTDWVTTDKGLALFSSDPERARASYRAFIEESLRCRSPEGQPPTLLELARTVCARHGVHIESLRSGARSRVVGIARTEFAKAALAEQVGNVEAVADFRGKPPSSVSLLLK